VTALATVGTHDGSQIRANVVMVADKPTCMTVSAPNGLINETFFADTGANKCIHTNSRAAANFYRIGLKIGTANSGETMKSEGVGKMLLYTPNGLPMPGFSNVVFAKASSGKLASVGDICDEKMVCVFDEYGLRIYKANEVKIEGEIFTQDKRDPKTRLYPLSLYRKAGERDVAIVTNMINILNTSETKILPTTRQGEMCEWGVLPASIQESPDGLPTTMLAKTYKRPDLSDVDRYHAKFGDVGIKYQTCPPFSQDPQTISM
jgi:hypothetical protein